MQLIAYGTNALLDTRLFVLKLIKAAYCLRHEQAFTAQNWLVTKPINAVYGLRHEPQNGTDT